MTKQLCVVGAGRSGAVAAACLADLGHSVRAVDVHAALVTTLNEGRAPFFEPDLDDVLSRNLAAGRLSFTTSYAEAVPDADFVLLCVGTPPQANGDSDLSALTAALDETAPLLRADAIVITRSTVPVGTNAWIADRLRSRHPGVAVVSNPEFLREGHAVADFLQPDRIVIGAATEAAGEAAAALYRRIDCPIIRTGLETAEVAKYAANAYLAASVSFINEIANICEKTGADVAVVSQALALDKRIGSNAYLDPGVGFGGSCLPKDLHAIVATAERHGYTPSLLKAVIETNELQPKRVVQQLEELFRDLRGLTVAVLGISFKGGTFDIRSSPALKVIDALAEKGARVRAFDPMDDGSTATCVDGRAEVCGDAYAAAEGASALIIATGHTEFLDLDLERLGRAMASLVFVDGRNLFEPDDVARAGFSYIGVGRPRRGD